MANEYVININAGETTKGKTASANTAKPTVSQEQVGGGLLNGAKVLAGIKIAENLASNVINYNISTVSLRTGQEEYQQKLQFASQVGQRTFDSALAITAGAMVGGLPGAIAGIIFGLGTTAISIAQKQNTINLQKQNEDMTISLNNQRIISKGNR